MAIFVKNKELKKKIFKSMKKYDDLAIKAYNKGNLARGRKYEAKSDKLYKDNYNKMFGIR